ncbi:hypothetical protein [Bacillus sp. PS06]|uniref:hypothetical protein n=1 Tax=Bacillus sp. PS06 TaxID=2764176 RepID=UPI00178715F5|nr:hypothetical protein [Bacillus sp. PS06]MBD8070092.1 hypothetical protein [Bacillus sp. PS06]
MIKLWGIVLISVVLLLLFGYLLDKTTNRYKQMNDKNAKEGLETIKDETQKNNPPNSNQIGPW